MKTSTLARVLLPALFRCAAFLSLFFLAAAPCPAQFSTVEHLLKPGFWPTKVDKSSDDYIGSTACAKCHSHLAAEQALTSMAQSLSQAGSARVLQVHPSLRFDWSIYSYEIKSSGDSSIFTVSDGNRSLSAPLLWAFGDGGVGQSYLFERDGNWYEARASFFGSLDNLHFTPARALVTAHDLEEAMSRPVGVADLIRCFKCHSSGITSDRTLDTAHLSLGVGCEACHGAGAKHAASMESSTATASLLFDPAGLSPNDSVDFCGSCHSTWWDVRLTGTTGVHTLLSPPYRLVGSKCWGKGDARLTCVVCHDPHAPRARQAESYDSKCLACHAAMGASTSTEHPQRPCPVAPSECTSCHMPKVEVPDFHHAFTDHRIRIARPNDAFPS